jgi:hypothetical protein
MQQLAVTIQNWPPRASSAQQRGLGERGVKYTVSVTHFTHQIEHCSCYMTFIIHSVLKNIQNIFAGYENLPCIQKKKK